MGNIITHNFHGTELYGFEQADGVFVALKPIVAALGLDWSGQLQRVKRDAILSEGMGIIPIPFGSGGEQEAACLRLDLLNGWLFGISAGSIKDADKRQAVLIYQRECYRTLARAFGRGGASGELPGAPPVDVMDQDRARRLVSLVQGLFGDLAGRQLYLKLGLPTVPAMYGAPVQLPLFTYDAHPRQGGQP